MKYFRDSNLYYVFIAGLALGTVTGAWIDSQSKTSSSSIDILEDILNIITKIPEIPVEIIKNIKSYYPLLKQIGETMKIIDAVNEIKTPSPDELFDKIKILRQRLNALNGDEKINIDSPKSYYNDTITFLHTNKSDDINNYFSFFL